MMHAAGLSLRQSCYDGLLRRQVQEMVCVDINSIALRQTQTSSLLLCNINLKGAITSKMKHAIKLKTSPARLNCCSLHSHIFSSQPMTVH